MKPLNSTPTHGATKKFYRRDALLKQARLPDLLVHHNSNFQALSSVSVLYFSKDGDAVRVYCMDRRSYKIDLSISQLWLKINHRSFFRRASKNLIVNSNHIMSINRNGRKLIFLRNGEEIALDESLFPKIMDSVVLV